MRLLAVRARSCHEVRSRLVDAGFDRPTADAVESRLVAVGLLDDSAFAAEVVRRGGEAGSSSRLTRRRLLESGVDPGTADDSLTGMAEPAAEEARALALAEKQAWSCRYLPTQKAIARVVRHLSSRGYDAQLAWEVTRRAFRDLELSGD